MKEKHANYWEKRYRREGKIWGENPSVSVNVALKYFLKKDVRRVLVPGSGYGRNAEALAKAGFEVSGIEISDTAYRTAVNSNNEKEFGIDYTLGDVVQMPYEAEQFEGVYCFNLLHLFKRKERTKFTDNLYRILKPDGIVVLTVFSERERSFGKGKEIEFNTFESKKDRPVHYFTEKDLNEQFKKFNILENMVIEDPENHGDGPHTHLLRLIVAQKPSNPAFYENTISAS